MASKLVMEILAQKNALELLNRNSNLSQVLRTHGVVRSREFQRVRDLPRRQRDESEDLAQAVGDLLFWAAGGKGPTPLPLRPLQAAMLCEAADQGGLTASLQCGGGKSWLAPLFATDYVPRGREGKWPQILCDRPVILIPPALRPEVLGVVVPRLKRVYRLHPNLKVIAYSELQTASGSTLLDRLNPDLLICDEAHSLKRLTSARTKRVKLFIKEHPQCKFIGMSGTITSKSLRDFWHLLMWSHPLNCPLPTQWRELEDWANAVDAEVAERMPPGVLVELCEDQETPREGLRRRLTDTRGFVATAADSLGVSLVVRARRDLPKPSDKLAKALADARDAWITPDGDELPDGASAARVARELALGFYYRWVWPGGVRDQDWLDARTDWARVVRDVVRRGAKGLDTELLVRNACKRCDLSKTYQGAAASALAAWEEQSKKPDPETEPVWIDESVMDWCAQWATTEIGIIWYEFGAVADAIERRGVRTFRGGTDEELTALAAGHEAGEFSIALSRPSHFQGKNLQAWASMLLTTVMPNGATIEQTIGRSHRPGQTADEVTVDFLAHHFEAIDAMKAAVDGARYTQETLGNPQKILLASCVDWSRDLV